MGCENRAWKECIDLGRWMPEHEATLPSSALLPFGPVPHICTGNHVAGGATRERYACLARDV